MFKVNALGTFCRTHNLISHLYLKDPAWYLTFDPITVLASLTPITNDI